MLNVKEKFAVRKMRVRTHLKRLNKSKLNRLSVFQSGRYIYAQVINDIQGTTVLAVNTLQKEFATLKKRYNIEAAKAVGQKLAELSLKQGIQSVILDKGGYKYHGKIKALADSAREAGLKI